MRGTKAGDLRIHKIFALGVVLLAAILPVRASSAAIVEVPVTFEVQNLNRSKVPCLTDGASYTIAGYLVAPSSALSARDPAVTVYLHGSMLPGHFLWRVKGFDGDYDFASRMAERGHASVVIDRIGFGDSGLPYGNLSCLGGQADVEHQVIQQLRTGTYEAGSADPVAFSRVALAGHSWGGLIAPIEAYSFGDVDALLELSSAFDQGFPASFYPNVVQNAGLTCAHGGDSKNPGGPKGYTFTFAFPEDFFHDIDPDLLTQTRDSLERDPCGDDASAFQALSFDRLYLGSIAAPVLFVAAENDFAFPPEVVQRQQALYSGSSDNTLVTIEAAGHDYMLERGLVGGVPATERFRLAVHGWLSVRGF